MGDEVPPFDPVVLWDGGGHLDRTKLEQRCALLFVDFEALPRPRESLVHQFVGSLGMKTEGPIYLILSNFEGLDIDALVDGNQELNVVADQSKTLCNVFHVTSASMAFVLDGTIRRIGGYMPPAPAVQGEHPS